MIYLDNAATTYPKPEVTYLALDKANRNAFNAGRGSYDKSREAFNVIEETRIKLASLLCCESKNVIFNSSATESLNMIIYGINIMNGDTVYVSPFEHNAVIRPLHNLQKDIDFRIEILPFDKKTWKPDIEKISGLFSIHPPKAIFISHISNVTGYLVPYVEIFELGSKWNSINILDCSQSLGVVNPENLDNVSYVVFAGHKSLYASFGVAGFVKFKEDDLKVIKTGGTGSDSLNYEMPLEIPNRYEAGSSNIVAISGLNASLDWLKSVAIREKEEKLYDYLNNKIDSIPKIIKYRPVGANTFGVLSINVEGYLSEDVAAILSDEYDICVRAGYHCAPLVHDFIESKNYKGTVRISLNYFNEFKDIDTLIEALKSL